MSKMVEEIEHHQQQSAPEVITVDGSSFVKNHDGSLIKIGGDDYDDSDSNLIYRYEFNLTI